MIKILTFKLTSDLVTSVCSITLIFGLDNWYN